MDLVLYTNTILTAYFILLLLLLLLLLLSIAATDQVGQGTTKEEIVSS
jgi:hypothetical protein